MIRTETAELEDFKNYLISEYSEQAKGFVAVEFKFSHSVNLKIDKETKKPLQSHIIKVSMKFVNKDLETLHTASVQFENNLIPKAKAKHFIRIAPKELEVKFGFAKNAICKTIYAELNEKLGEIKLKLNNLRSYSGTSGIEIIPGEFKGELIQIEENSPEEPKPKSNSFEM